MTTSNPSAGEFAALVSDRQAADERARRAYNAVAKARPTELAAMAAQLRWLAERLSEGIGDDGGPICEHVANRLDALAVQIDVYTAGRIDVLTGRRDSLAA